MRHMFADNVPNEVSIDPFGMFCDHGLVTCRLLENVSQAITAKHLLRGWHCIDRTVLCYIPEGSPLCHRVLKDANVDDLIAKYMNV